MATVDVVFKVNSEHIQRFINGMAEYYGYTAVFEDGTPNPETKAQYARRKIREEWVQRVIKMERQAQIEQISIDEIEVTD